MLFVTENFSLGKSNYFAIYFVLCAITFYSKKYKRKKKFIL